jgi:3'-phosphoadenosine 5'-phosphosulfate sulfotransferase (PAPS reductase)/FAD synthetase
MIELANYDMIIVNSSGGKDSVCALWQMVQLAKEQGYPMTKIHISHADLGEMEWKGTKELVGRQAEFFGLQVHYTKRRTESGIEENLLDHIARRGKWPSNKQRFCTSDHKRGPGGRVVTALTKGQKLTVLHIFGFRASESPCRKKKEVLQPNKLLTTKKRIVTDYLPIHDWSDEKVWTTIRECRGCHVSSVFSVH